MKATDRITAPPMREWQYKQLLGCLGAIQGHSLDWECPCNQTDLGKDGKYNGEYCLGKHLIDFEFLSRETGLMDLTNQNMLEDLANEASDFLKKAKSIYCKGGTWPDLAKWSREARKKLEPLYYSCQVKAKLHEDPFPDVVSLFESHKLINVSGTCKPAGVCSFKVSHNDKTEASIDGISGLPATIDEVLRRISEHKQEVSNKTFGYGTTGLIRYDFEYRIVDGLKLIASNDPFTFEPRPEYPRELQPRIRARAAAELQVKNIAANLIADILLVDFRATDRGAPIIGPDMVVESGNGRIMALVLSSRDAPAKFTEYVAALKRIAPAYGLNPADADKFTVPVLVRIRLTEVNRKDFAQDCNAPVALEQSAIEKARTDAEKITVAMLGSIQVDEGQSVEDAIRSQANKSFVVAFMNKLPQNEQAKLLDAQGTLNSDGLRRIILAIFVSTFQGDIGLKLAEAFFESTDVNVKNILNGITGSLGIISRAEGLCLSGARYADYAIGVDLAKAVTKYSEIKRTPGMTVAKYISQQEMISRQLTPFQERILQALDEHSRSGKRIAGILSLYAQKVIDSAPPGQASMMMAGERYTKEELFDSAVKSVVMDMEEEREEARRKAEAKRQPVAAMSEIANLFEVANLRQQLRFMVDDEKMELEKPQPVVQTTSSSPTTASVSPDCAPSIAPCPVCQVVLPNCKKLELFGFQKRGVEWLASRSVALLADDMGLGKTPQAIWWGADKRPCLVISPANAIYNWEKEITKMWRPGDSCIVFDGNVPFPDKLPDWCVMAYGALPKYLPKLRKAGFKTIMVDEAHMVKNMTSQRTKMLLELVDPTDPQPGDKPITNRLPITGTPVLNRPIELFPLLVFMGLKRRSEYKEFMKLYTESKEYQGRTIFTGAKNLPHLHRYLQGFMLRRMKLDELKDLPPKIFTPMFVPISNRDEYIRAERDFLTWLRENKGNEAADRAKKAVLLAKMNTLRRIAAEGKVQPVADWLKPCSEGQGKVIIFSQFKEPLDKLAAIKGSSIVYTGEVNKKDKQEFVDNFQQTNDYCYFLGTTGAAGVAITLTAASRVCFLDLPWTPGAKAQAEDRAWRFGQKKTVEVVNILAKGTIDERMLEILNDKEFIISQAVDGKTKEAAINDSISGSLLDSFRRNPNLNENVRQYEAELKDSPVDMVDADTLEIMQGLHENTCQLEEAKLFEKYARLHDELSGFILKKLFPCNLSNVELEKVLAWRPLRDFLAWAVGTKKAVQICSIGLVPGVFQVSIKGIHDITDIESEVNKRAKAIPTARKVYSPTDAVFEIVVPDESREKELSFMPQEINRTPARRQAEPQAALFEKGHLIIKVKKGMAETINKPYAFVIRGKGNKSWSVYNFPTLGEAREYAKHYFGEDAEGYFTFNGTQIGQKFGLNNPIPELKESGDTIKITGKCDDGKPERCVFKLKRVGNSLKIVGTTGIGKALGSPALKESLVPANVKTAIMNPVNVSV
jgi:SWI/SNF-related matrix-associated actin-dependent regulator 1 of chromatin subfamily A